MLIQGLLIISLLQTAIGTSMSCQTLMMKMLKEYKDNPTLLIQQSMPYFAYSGKGDKEFGDYDACNRLGLSYSSLNTYSNLGQAQLGICHSPACTSEDLNAPSIQAAIRKYLDDSGIAKLIGLIPYSIQMKFLDPLNIEIGFGAVITIMIIVVLFILVLVLPSINQIRKLKNKEIQINKKLENILKLFSITHNMRQLTNVKVQDPNLKIFTGLRAIGFLTIVFGHQYFIIGKVAYSSELSHFLDSWTLLWLIDCLYSVDLFFWIGGFFLGYIATERKQLKSIVKSPSMSALKMVVHRLIRILPAYILTIMIVWNIFPLLGSGPRWHLLQYEFDCSTWWRNVLFIDNQFNDDRYCLGWSWYLSNDFQLFLISIIPILVYARVSRKWGKYIIVVLLVATQIYGTVISYSHHYLIPFFSMQSSDITKVYYQRPTCRGPPYFLGLLFGILYQEHKAYILKQNEEFIPLITRLNRGLSNKRSKYIAQTLLYGLGLSLILILCMSWRGVQVTQDREYWPEAMQEFWHSICRLVFAIAITLISLVNILGIRDKFINFMNNWYFMILARLSFSGYLIHYGVIVITATCYYQTPEYTNASNLQFFIGNMIIILMIALLLTLLVEIPVGNIYKLMTTKQRQYSFGADVRIQQINDQQNVL